MLNQNSQYMKLAIQEAWKYQLLTYPNPAVGATVVRNNKVISVEAHHESGLPHAEVMALKSAYLSFYPNSILKTLMQSQDIHNYLILNHNDYFKDCEIYVTLEPCNHIGKTPACSMLLVSIGIKKVYIGTLDPNVEASGGMKKILDAGIEIEHKICKAETDKLLFPFLKYQSGHFNFFKMAMREDGSIDGGYITTHESLTLVHNIRTKIDLMVMGGNTVRLDRPTLDSRFSKNKNSPNILIYSTLDEFDKTIPLFNVKNREVTISSSLDLMQNNKFIMIEGGYSLLKKVQEHIDYLMIFISHKNKSDNKFPIDNSLFSIEYSYYINDYDEVVYLKKINDK
jgi:diaminohydroxyphosphoribosylaminopyrimidine deaminase/5-amino-6-(5-phosphoribosylamino)uracil reductase